MEFDADEQILAQQYEGHLQKKKDKDTKKQHLIHQIQAKSECSSEEEKITTKQKQKQQRIKHAQKVKRHKTGDSYTHSSSQSACQLQQTWPGHTLLLFRRQSLHTHYIKNTNGKTSQRMQKEELK